MRSFWRVLLVWLAALAIPIQGVAAVGMTHCQGAPGPAQQHGAHAHTHPQGLHSQAGQRHHGDQHLHEQAHGDHHAMNGSAHAAMHDHMAVEAQRAGFDHAGEEGNGAWPPGAATPDTSAASSHAGKVSGVDKKCSACAACCAAVALPAHVPEVPMLDLVSTPASLTEVDSVSYIASGPERPPRSHLD